MVAVAVAVAVVVVEVAVVEVAVMVEEIVIAMIAIPEDELEEEEVEDSSVSLPGHSLVTEWTPLNSFESSNSTITSTRETLSYNNPQHASVMP